MNELKSYYPKGPDGIEMVEATDGVQGAYYGVHEVDALLEQKQQEICGLAWHIQRIRVAKQQCSGYEPSISVLYRAIDLAPDAEAVEAAVRYVSNLLAAKQEFADTPERTEIIDHKLDVVLAFEQYAKKLRSDRPIAKPDPVQAKAEGIIAAANVVVATMHAGDGEPTTASLLDLERALINAQELSQ